MHSELMIDLELCGDSLASAKIAGALGFKRIELCANLNEGGTTPSIGMIQLCSSLKAIEVHVMIRPRPGSFTYTKEEIEIMSRDIVAASIAGAKGVVFGCLTSKNELDLGATLHLAEIALRTKLELTFHRAIDYTSNPLETLAHLQKLGFTRVLSSGCPTTVSYGAEQLKRMVDFSQHHSIEIMAGGGVNATNARSLSALGLHALHFTARKQMNVNLPSGMGVDFEVDEAKIRSIKESLI